MSPAWLCLRMVSASDAVAHVCACPEAWRGLTLDALVCAPLRR